MTRQGSQGVLVHNSIFPGKKEIKLLAKHNRCGREGNAEELKDTVKGHLSSPLS